MAYEFEKISVLIVEDVAPMQNLLVSVLRLLGVGKLYIANDGEEGYEKYKTHRPDFILSDWMMSPTDGLEMTKKIRRDAASPEPTTPIILMTGYSSRDRVEKARDTGITEFLIKPFKAEDIAKRIMHIIEHPRDFIDNSDYIGPDRRRHNPENYDGPFRRNDDKKGKPE